MLKVFTDAGARGNPGPAATGVYILDEKDNKIAEIGDYIGIATNNVAEYKAVISALDWLLNNKNKITGGVNFFIDSNLVCSQINGLFKVKNANLRDLLFLIREKESALNIQINYKHIPREQNKKADAIVNMVLDNKTLAS